MAKNNERALIIAWLVINFAIGLWIVRDYGLSYDEPNYYRYANYSLEAYKSFFGQLFEPDYGFGNLQYYGPAFILIVNSIIKILHFFPVDFLDVYVWHYAYFVTFQLTGLCLYGLAKRWFNRWTAWAVLAIFITQPILWGQAFINPKDIPFMFFFAFSVWTGYRFVDFLGGETASFSIKNTLSDFHKRWEPIDPHKKRTFLWWFVIIVVGLAFSRRLVYFAIERVITFFYLAEPDSWAGELMAKFAEHITTIPVIEYINKAQTLYVRFDFLLFILSLLIICGYLISLLKNTSLIIEGKRLGAQVIKHIHLKNVRDLSSQILTALITPKIILAGIILGLTTSIRVLGPLAGAIVILYLWIQIRQRSFPIILAYLLWTGLVTYLTWPFLWSAPVANFIESLSFMSNFPWQGEVLFNGEFYKAFNIPITYLPVLLNIQFTEIFILLWYVGLGFLIWKIFRQEIRVDLLLYLGLGFLLPVVSLIVFRSPLYDNFRQLLFLLPAMILYGAFVLEILFEKIRQSWLRLSLIILIITPGLISLAKSHPYQYVYYNSFVGGVAGADQRYELDYWLTSMNELTTWVNENAGYGAKIAVKVAPDLIAQQLRSDLTVKKIRTSRIDVHDDYDYAILSTRWKGDDIFPNTEIISIVELDGAILGVLKNVKGYEIK